MTIGVIDGNDVVYNQEDDTLSSKTFTVKVEKLLSAYESPFDRVNVKGNLVLRKYKNEITLGCFSIPLDKFEEMKSNLINKRLNK